jgi:hypothetical protein
MHLAQGVDGRISVLSSMGPECLDVWIQALSRGSSAGRAMLSVEWSPGEAAHVSAVAVVASPPSLR